MKKEITEIIEYIKDENIYIEEHDYCYKRLSLEECSVISNYIRDLQYRINKATEYLLDKYVRGLLEDNEINYVVKILKGEE